MTQGELNGLEVAIVGLAGRFPGAKNVAEYWQNLREGIDTISSFSTDELLSAGIDLKQANDPAYVRRGGVIDDIDLFDAAFFGYSPREAAFLDPQQRLFLECAEEALENAGYDARSYREAIGVYAGIGLNTYFLRNLHHLQNWSNSNDIFQMITANDKDFLASRVAYKLNLRGPALVVQTACSTSLVAVHMAVRALVGGECSMALAGGVTIRVPQKAGYHYQEGGILSADGYCRAFDAQAQGTVSSNGVGIVVLKRLEDALADHDHIYAVIKGSAINNDGSSKVGYTAPGIQGQIRVIQDAQLVADIDAESIGYIETHGTGTANGDPIEIAALTEAFRSQTSKKNFCAIGSVKTNIGHLDAASGIAGLIKTIYSLQQGILLPSLHFHSPNPALQLESSPFYVNKDLRAWTTEENVPRRAGVSSFGIGGTNAHVLLEEAPVTEDDTRSVRPHQLIVLSARTENALKQASINLAAHIHQQPELELADIAYTLQVGRPLFHYRQALVCHTVEDVARELESENALHLMRASIAATETSVVFMFPGQGTQYIDMGRDLYRTEAVFRAELDRCAELLRSYLGVDLREALYLSDESKREEFSQRLTQTWLTQPALFAVEYALAKQWESWGVHPAAMIGHSIGEYVAACLAGVFSLEDALQLVTARGRLMQQLPEASMLAITLPAQELQALLTGRLSIAAINTHTQCVVAGPTVEIEGLMRQLQSREINCRLLHTSHAFHSILVEPIVDEYVALVRSIQLHSPQRPYISNVTGTWISAEEATDPDYWGLHIRQPVLFAAGIEKILQADLAVLLEVGPGRTLSTFARHQSQAFSGRSDYTIVPSLRRPTETLSDDEFMLTSLGRLWLAGVSIAWDEFHADELCYRVPLPAYPFERQRYWIDPLHYNVQEPDAQLSFVDEENTQEIHADSADTTLYPRPILPTPYVAPRNQLEATLAEMWQELLGIAQVGIYDSFFELGGHSLLATQLVSRLRAELQVSVPLRTIFEATTVAELGHLITEQPLTSMRAEELAQPIHPLEREGTLPLSYAQRRLWFMQQMEQDAGFLNIPLGIRLRGPLNLDVLQQSLQEITHRHESLRTTFALHDGMPEPLIASVLDVVLEVEDLQGLAGSERELALQQLATQMVRRPFDLEHGPLFRVTVFKLDPVEHVLLIAMHHCISDGWSFSVLLHELIDLYSAFSNGHPSPLEPLAVQYVDFAAWQQQWLQGDEVEQQLAYWRKQLGGPLPALELPTDHPRPAIQSYRGAHFPFQFPTTLTENIKALGQQEGATVFMLLLAAFQVICSRYSGQEDILIGTPIANRRRTEIEKLIGCFINTLVIRTDLAGNLSFRELLHSVREKTLEAYAHQDLPFEQVVEALQPDRDLSRSPIFQVMFMLQNVPFPPTEFADLQLHLIDIDNGATQFDLTFIVNEIDEHIAGLVEYNADLFEVETIRRMVDHWQGLLTSVVTDCAQHVKDVPLLTQAEQQHLQAWNSTGVEWEEPACVQDMFAAQVTRTPDAVALVWEGNVWTYAALNRAANRVASRLRALGVGPGKLVGICLERSAELVVALLGVLKSGGAYVPLDPAYPQERLTYMLRNSQATALLIREEFVDRFALNDTLACVELPLPADEESEEEELSVKMDGEALAYVIYTSGSTGTPKGVMISHRAMRNCFLSMAQQPGMTAADSVLAVTSFSFDIAALELLLPLMVGASTVIASREDAMDAFALLHLIETTQTSFMQATPATWRLLLNAGWQSRSMLKILCGGEALPLELAQQLGHRSDSVWNMYGPTETTIWSTISQICAENASISIGHPIANTQVYVLDPQGIEVPVGVAGELFIGGDGVAHGYWQLPVLTAERFVPDPFTDQPGARLYRTGDLVRRTADGALIYLNRLDFQVKVRGHRIELGEIETRLVQHPLLSECVVVVKEEREGDARLVAYIIPQTDAIVDARELRSFMQQSLPEYMIPAYFVPLERWPLTPNGKIDRKALPTPDFSDARVDFSSTPTTIIEEILLDVWAKVLQRAVPGTDASFFDLGGHSLLATQLLAQVRELFSLEVPLRSVFEAPTVAAFAALLDGLLRQGQDQHLSPLVPVKREPYLPASFAQQRLWFLEQLVPDTAAYHIPLAVRMRGPLNILALEQSIGELIRRHESLRTAFTMQDGQVKQSIHPFTAFSLPVLSLRTENAGERERELQALISAEILKLFDLTHPPLLRATLFSVHEEEHVLLVTMHHIISDGPSYNIFIDELMLYYASFARGDVPGIVQLPLQYADFVSWQNQWLSDERLDVQLTYWKQKLSKSVALELPTDHPRPATQTFNGADIVFTLPPSLTASLQALSRSEGVTLFMTLLATFQMLLATYTGQDDITVGTPVTNRNRTELEGLIGFFVNTLVLRTDLSHNPGFIELLARVRETCLEAYTHQDLPFEQIVDAIQPERDLSRSPIFQVMFMLQHAPDMDSFADLADLQLSLFPVGSQTSKFDLTLDLTVVGQTVHGRLEYATDLFDVQTMERLIGHWQTLLASVVANPNAPIASLPLLTAAEYQLCIEEWNATQSVYPAELCLHQLVEAQVERTPHQPAAIFEEEQLSYHELNQRANQLAHYLQTVGVGPEIRVGIYMEPSLEMLIAVLAVLKAGGGYIPLDRAYPSERIAFLLKDAGIALLLVQQRHADTVVSENQSTRIIPLDTLYSVLDQQPVDNPVSRVCPDNLAYILYTSGSTGIPKGVMISHKGLVNYLHWARQRYAVAEGSGAPVHSSLTFDLTVTSLFSPLISGRTTVLLPFERGVESLNAAFHKYHDFSLVKITPAHLALLSQQPDLRQYASSTRLFVIGGEQLLADKLAVWQELAPETKFINEYGPTETVVGCCIYQVPNAPRESGPVPIGRPIANTQIYLLNRYLQPVPPGIPGEIYIGGFGLARGYLNRPELTAERFIPNPFSAQAGSRLYRTGDLARYRPDGNLEFLGRNDHQVKVRGFRIELGEIEAVLSQHPDIRECAVLVQEDKPEVKRLVAYIVPRQMDMALSQTRLRDYIQQYLPDYMTPALFVQLERLPLSSNGKLDRDALPVPGEMKHEEGTTFVEPRTPAEQILARIWTEVLGIDRVSITDNFFALGGDSLLSMQIIARAAQANLRLTPRQIFQQQTIEALAAVVNTYSPFQAEQGLVEGPVQLTPIQHWFFEQKLNEPYHWNQSALLQLAEPCDPVILEKAMRELVEHHDALRMRFTQLDETWQQTNGGQAEASYKFTYVDFAGESSDYQKKMIMATHALASMDFDLAQGPLLSVVFFDLGPQQASLLLICIHHLIVDNVSWQILLADLQIAYQSLIQHKQPQFPPKTTSYQSWAQQLLRYAQSEEVIQEQAFWLEENYGVVPHAPLDFPVEAISNTVASGRTYSLSLSQEETSDLLANVSRAHQVPMNDIVLAMLALICARWIGTDCIHIDTEGHGREEISDEIDVSRTVGWFTSIYPIYLQLSASSSESEALQRLQARLSHLPHKGFGYGALRYLNEDPELRQRFRMLPQADILLNYVGQIDQMISSATLFKDIYPSSEFDRSSSDKRPYLFEIISGIRDGKLYIDWKYSADTHHESTIERLASDFMQAVRTLMQHYRTMDVPPLVSNISRVPLTQEKFEQLLAELEVDAADIETIDTLSPAQQGMFYETLSAPGTGIHVEQWNSTLSGNLDVEAFRRAWQWVIDRHTIFRTSFIEDAGVELMQVTLRHVPFPIIQHDLRAFSSEEQVTYLDQYAKQDRNQGFKLSHAPLMRLTLFQLGHDTYRFILTYHHMLMDLWCHHLVIEEVFACYQAYCNKQSLQLEPSLPYTEYIAWLKKQDVAEAERFWRSSLHGFASPTVLGRITELSAPEIEKNHASELLMLSASTTAALQRVARQHRVTLNTLFQGTWALLLSRYGRTDDVLFGITVAGRPPELPGIETMIGLCINTLPLRIQLKPDGALWDWLQTIQYHNLDLRQYEYTPAGLIHTWSSVPGGQPLYESLLVVENFPESFFNLHTTIGNVTISKPELKGAQTQHALTLLVTVEKEELGVGCIYDQQRISQPMVERILGHFCLLLEQLASGIDQSLDTLRNLITDEQIPVVYPVARTLAMENDPPRTPVERLLVGIWQQVLGMQQVGIHANFLELGGHSLLATQLISRIRTTFQLDFPLRQLFEYPTIALLAEQLTQFTAQASSAVAPIVPVPRNQPLPLSLAQQRLWFLDQLIPERSVYNITRSLHIRGPLNISALMRSIEEIMQRHEILRTTFPARDGQAIQIIHPRVDLAWSEIDLAFCAEEKREVWVSTLIQDEVRKPLDLANGPLLRTLLLKLDREEHILVVTIHHIVFDVWSEGVFLHELAALYQAFTAGQSSPLTALPIQYADFAVWQRQWLQGDVLNDQIAYWQRQLQNASVLALPTDKARQARQGYQGAMKEFTLDGELSNVLNNLSRQEGVTLFMTLLAGFMTLLLRYTGQTDIVVGTDIANRTWTETEQLIGFFVNLLVLRGDLSRNPRFSDLLQQIRQMVLDAYAHQDLPFEKLINVLHLEREGGQTPLVRVLFVFQNIPWTMPSLDEITITPAPVEQDITRFELAFFMWETPEGLKGTINYSTDLFEHKTINDMITHFKTLLQNISAQPTAHLDTLKMYSEEAEKTKRASQLGRLKKKKI
ncbi:non-ribosomal peptide synthetase/type I polyketide synthase [Dictyobacter arantiisoli]|uniref:Phenolphthiocerol/phthiocerol polyketide synthase subunit E n=1 Tax=Dictyobacter arantiisoli TaxID=2014874 RepID=A0A5A5TEH4_9CHLR|nr:non-ribosomal peptide synthetase/type I polyketide synthase [Dictyobacter arantiisoli]GCF09960.1 hypothetical protein KDI_35240 [Dictyobacter arantiisoli]